ncbi:TIR domain-containing protein [uncultured Sphingomonas sp.]|uniref:TIR domain-containing protein n=1 Tax=uncultured Sphingomonas sp. TaxID=158754 RepID=UPI0025D9836F|nr:TIR domain-containing protein [uncultured Sphingomonas sp.]
MAKGGEQQAAAGSDKPKRVRVSQSDVPAYSLNDTLRVAMAIAENYASAPTKPLDVAAAMNLAPNSSHFRMLTGSAIAYGLTTGGYNASEIALTPLCMRIISPLEEGDDLAAKREALLSPNIIGSFLNKYNGSPLPTDQIALNVLISMGVPKERSPAVYQLILEGAESLGLLQEIKSKKYVNLDRRTGNGVSLSPKSIVSIEAEGAQVFDVVEIAPIETNSARKDAIFNNPKAPNKKVFMTHGHNKGLVDPIKKLLAFGELEPVVSVERQSVSQPVPDKVMNDMRECGAAIIHVEGEMTLLDAQAQPHVVLNPNVLIEIGAAMALYDKRFILLVKEGVKLPSNLQGLYEVRYDGDTMDGNSTIRLLEAINHLKTIPS